MMMNKGSRHLTALLFSLFLLLPAAAVQAAAESVAKVASVVGDADVKRAANGKTEPLRFKSEIFLNDVVITDLGSQVKLLLKDSSILKVGPKSEMKIDQLLVGADDQSNTTINLIKGRLRSIVGRKLGVTSSFEVRTSVAVAGVRGTIFDGLAIPARGGRVGFAAFRGLEGRVAVRSTNPNIPDVVTVTPNTFTVIVPDQPPTDAEPIGEGENLEKKAASKAKKSEKEEDKQEKKEEKAADKEQKSESDEGSADGAESGGTEDDGAETGDDAGTESPTGDDAGTGGEDTTLLDTAEGDVVPEMDLGDDSALGQNVVEDVDPTGTVATIEVEPETGADGGTGSTDPVNGTDDPATGAGGDEQLDIIDQPPVVPEDAVSVPLQIVIPSP